MRILGSEDAATADETKLLAVSHAVQMVGEAANHLSGEAQAELPQIHWTDIIGMRHRLVHGYRTRNSQVIVDTVRQHLPPLVSALKQALDEDE